MSAPLADAFAVAWRRHRTDSLATLIIYAAAVLAAGRIWRFPFDDEVSSLAPNLPLAFRGSLWGLARFYLEGGDNHPPLSFLYFAVLGRLGFGEAEMRLASLAMTALALVLWQLIALALVVRRAGAPADAPTRLVAVLLFGLTPLAIGWGDAIRWYPPFALCVAVFAALYLAAGTVNARLVSAMPLGLATSINLIAPLVLLPLAIYRYGLERAGRPRFDIAYWAVFALFASPGLYSAIWIAKRRLAFIWADKFGAHPPLAVASDALGFLGGNAIGLGEAWVLVPAAATIGCAAVALIDRRDPANPVHLPLLLLAAMIVSALLGFDESRSFLYLSPVASAVLTVFLSRIAASAAAGRVLLLIVGAVLPGLVAIGELRGGNHPFKRNLAVPYGAIIDFVERNNSGDALLLSTDPIVPWELRKRADPGLCISYLLDEPACLAPAQPYRSVFILSGRSGRPAEGPAMQRLAARVAELTAGREKIAGLRVGHDEDARLKTWLTGITLDRFILTVDLYR